MSHEKAIDVPLPIKRNRNGAEPRSQPRAESAAPDCVSRAGDAPDLLPNRTVHTMNVDKRRRGKNGHMRCTEQGLGIMCSERGTEKDEENGQDRSG